MNAVEIEEAICQLVDQPFGADEFPYAFLEAFGNPEPTIKRLRKGDTNRTDVDGAVLQRSNIHILVAEAGGVDDGLKALRESPKTVQQKAKFILVADGEELQAEDLKSGEVLACAFVDLPKHVGFLLPLAGISTVEEIKNNPIDIKATGRLDKLYVSLLEKNPEWARQENRKDFNHFMAQLIFCFFAEDTGIFDGEGLFSSIVRQMSDSDGSNTHNVISAIFEAMNLDPRKGERGGVRPYADGFPYVNGGLFGGDVKVPEFSRIARTYLLRAGELDWTAINPDIFGSMIQAVADDDERGELGMHYTSVPNILKVLNPLFLDSLNEDLEKAGNNKQQLGKLKKRLAHIRVFDPACGSGNFLVISYKRMREIEHRANIAGGWAEQVADVDGAPRWVGQKSVIPLTNFRGIEIKTFAAEIARLALIIAEYQCDELYMGQREALALFLPLEKSNWIACENALRVDWLKICPPTGETKVSIKLTEDDLFKTPKQQSEIDFENQGGETYICGNPPYKGSAKKSTSEKADLKQVLGKVVKNWGKLDYVAGWFFKAAIYLNHSQGAGALVATNSIVQGQHVSLLWPNILDKQQIIFGVRSFKWSNLAANDAGVTVVIVGIGNKRESKIIYDGDQQKTANNINGYLLDYPNISVSERRKPISKIPSMLKGNYYGLCKNIMFEREDYEALLKSGVPTTVLRKVYGSAELISSKPRYCFWLEQWPNDELMENELFADRINASRIEREDSKDARLNGMYDRPHQFREMHSSKHATIAIPVVSSENRPYLPVSLFNNASVFTNKNFALYDAPLWNMALIASRLHWVWIGTVCVRLEMRFSYSNTLGWNTFPVPKLTSQHKDDLTRAAENILLAREAHSPATIADLYKPDEMPDNLRAAHDANDRILEEIYIGRQFKNDTERLEKLFEMYTDMTNSAKN